MSLSFDAAIELTDIRWLVDRILHRDELLANGRSPFGAQLEMLATAHPQVTKGPRAGERAGLDWARKQLADDKHRAHAYLASLSKVWDAEETRTLWAKHTPATQEELAERGEDNERERACWLGDLRHERASDGSMHYRTLYGEIPIHICRGPDECEREDCTKEPGRVIVRGPVSKPPTNREVAERLGITVDRVRRTITRAYAKLAEELGNRAIREAAQRTACP